MLFSARGVVSYVGGVKEDVCFPEIKASNVKRATKIALRRGKQYVQDEQNACGFRLMAVKREGKEQPVKALPPPADAKPALLAKPRVRRMPRFSELVCSFKTVHKFPEALRLPREKADANTDGGWSEYFPFNYD